MDNEKVQIAIQIIKKLLFILLIVILYNTFLITKSALDDTGAKEIFGYKAYIITTDSMRPNIKVGDIVIVEQVEEEKLMIGDVITMKKAGEIITHRIVEVVEEEETEYITKGDNNNIEDLETVKYNQIEGKKILKIPAFGNAIWLLQSKIYSILLIIVILIILYITIKKYKKKKMRREKQLYYTGG